MTADAAVVVENAEKWFGLNPALANVSLRVQQGEFVVLLGRNGAGKSTLLRVMARLVKPNRGRVRICGVDVARDPERGRERIGLVAHQTFLYPGLSARENLRLHARLHGIVGACERVAAALSDAGLDLSADRPVRGFSRGMQQRLAIARATLHGPELVLLDEPFTGLDLEAAELLSQTVGAMGGSRANHRDGHPQPGAGSGGGQPLDPSGLRPHGDGMDRRLRRRFAAATGNS